MEFWHGFLTYSDIGYPQRVFKYTFNSFKEYNFQMTGAPEANSKIRQNYQYQSSLSTKQIVFLDEKQTAPCSMLWEIIT